MRLFLSDSRKAKLTTNAIRASQQRYMREFTDTKPIEATDQFSNREPMRTAIPKSGK